MKSNRKQFLVNNLCYRTGRPLKPQGVMVHSTGAFNPKLSRYVPLPEATNVSSNHWNQPTPGGRHVCVHGFIGLNPNCEVEYVQTLPYNIEGWHCGGSANHTHLSFEICEDDLFGEEYFKQVYETAVEVVADLCTEYGWNPLDKGRVICHSEGHAMGMASNHADVMHWFPIHGKNMDMFRLDVKKKMEEGDDNMTYEKWVEYMNRYRREQSQRNPSMPNLFNKAKEMGITDGSRPKDFCTREEAAVMASRK